jgi:aryl-alcohol dehydrogenase-like predicted oxidoreductase
VKAGKIRWYGCSNWTLPRIIEARAYAQQKGASGFVCNQAMWSLADICFDNMSDKTLVPMDKAMLAWHCETGISAMAYMSIAKGYFTRLNRSLPIPPEISATYQCQENHRIFAELGRLAKKTRLTITDLCYFYFGVQSFPAIPISAFSSETQIRDGMRHCEVTPPDSALIQTLCEMKSFIAEK